jgi:hypothetical protein
VQITKSKLKKIIKEETQKLLREQQRREKEIKQNIAYAQLAAEELRNQIKAAAPESDRSRAFKKRLQNVEGHIAKFQNELKPYHPTAQETYADVGMQSVMSPEQEREVLSGMEPYVSLEDWPPHRTVDWHATQASGQGWESVSSPALSAPFGQYMTTSGHPGIREAQQRDYYHRHMQRYEDEVARAHKEQSNRGAHEHMHYLGQGPVAAAQNRYKAGDPPWLYPGEERFRRGIFEKDIVATGNIQGEMGEVAYADWYEAYSNPEHPEHEIALLALPAVAPEYHLYPEKWRQITQGGEIIEAQAHQIIKEEFNHMLAEQYTAAAEYDPLLDPHGVDLGIEQSMFGSEGPEVIDYSRPPDLRQVHNVVPADRGQPHSEWMDEWAFNKERKKAVLDDIFFQVLDTIRKENPNLFDSPKQKKLPYVHYLNEEALKTE